jgi:phenylalanyl-tRNA synthetase beta chain
MMACGLNEAYTISFTSPKVFDLINAPKDHKLRNAVTISNPLGEDYSIMRTTTLPDILKVLAINNSRNIAEAELFELSYIYLPIEGDVLADERETLTIGMYGGSNDFFVIKGIIEELLTAMGIKCYEFRPANDDPSFHPGRTARLYVKGKDNELKYAAILGEIHPEVAEKMECPQRTYVAMADVSVLIEASDTSRQYKQLPKFPAITRDIAVVVKDDIFVAQLIDAIRQKGGEFLEAVELFDVYKGAQVPEGMKSIAFALSFRAADRTLKDEEVNVAMERIIKNLNRSFEAQLR